MPAGDSIEQKTIYVPTLLPNGDGTGRVQILGAFDGKVDAEWQIFRKFRELGYMPVFEIFECPLNVGLHVGTITVTNDT